MRVLGLIFCLYQLVEICMGSCPEVERKDKYNQEGKRLCATVYQVSSLNDFNQKQFKLELNRWSAEDFLNLYCQNIDFKTDFLINS